MSTPVLYRQVYQPLTKALKNFSAILTKAEKYADEQGLKHEDVIQRRLVPDQRGLDYQVQSCSNTVKWLLVRQGMMEDVKLEDNEETFEQLQKRITTTLELLEKHGGKPEQWKGKEAEPVEMKTGMGTFGFEDGQAYASQFALPNFHFHFATGYCILRHLGVQIGALDYLGSDTLVKKEE